MPLINLQNVLLSYGKPPLIDYVNLVIERGERVCIIGRNGAGKSTLLKIINGQVLPDEGKIERANDVKVAQLEQSVPQNTTGNVFDVISEGLGKEGKLIQKFHYLTQQLNHDSSPKIFSDLEQCHAELDRIDGWNINSRVESIITKMKLNPEADISSLSGGFKRRVLLARALVASPDLLLLDEPTNHLDIEAIQWIEQFLIKWEGSLLFISHDRHFMDNLANRFVEIDRGKLIEFNCDYSTYLARKQDNLAVEDKQNDLFDKRLSQEEIWIRQGIKARRTRNEGRVRALVAMRQEFSDRRKHLGTAKMGIHQAEKSGKIVAEASDISFSFGDEQLVRRFSALIQRGDKIGLIGRNGVGKTTLIKLLLGELSPDKGAIKIGTNLNVAYFDQYRSALDEEKSVQDNVSGGRDMLDVGGKSRHVISYLQDFLFAPERCRQPVKVLSGGERNRLLLAKLFVIASNVLVLDEPTNDLDIDTLDLLEELLIQYKGTIILVSHDRTFLNNVVTSTLVFEGNGEIKQFVGGYDDWLRQRDSASSAKINEVPKAGNLQLKSTTTKSKRSFNNERELSALPEKIDLLEQRITEISTQMSDASFYRSDRAEIKKTENLLKSAQLELEVLYKRWEELET